MEFTLKISAQYLAANTRYGSLKFSVNLDEVLHDRDVCDGTNGQHGMP